MLIKHHHFDSAIAEIPGRQVTVLLPDNYHELFGGANAAQEPLPYIVLHDGQNCLDEDGFGHGGWQVHRVMDKLINESKIPPMAAVLVPCHPNEDDRMDEYSPGPWFYPGNQKQYQGRLAKHDQWLMETVLPALHAEYQLTQDPAQCAIGGSSMGGISSFVTSFTYPEFGKLLCMSAPLALCAERRAFDLLADSTPDSRPQKIYLDAGTEFCKVPGDFSGDTREMNQALMAAGYLPGQDLSFAIFEGDEHNESYWRNRLPGALTFLFGSDK